MTERALLGDAAANLDDEVEGNADALLESLFADPWEIESDTANRDITPSPSADSAASPAPASGVSSSSSGGPQDFRTAQPPAVNPAGPVRREPFARSPNAPATSSRRPLIVSKSQRPLEPVEVEDALLYSEAKLKGVGLTPLPAPIEPSPLQSARVAPAKPSVEWRSIGARPAGELHPSLDWLEQSRLAVDRAGWLRAEAERHQDPERKGRLLLTCSELWALAGDADAALKAAREATVLLPSSAVAHRQLRQLSLHAGDTTTALTALEVELRHCTDEMRAHLLGLQAALAAHGNPVVFINALSELARCAPRDPRPALYRVAAQLAASPAPPEVLSGEDLPPGIAQALRELRLYRARTLTTPQGEEQGEAALPSLRFERARKALQRRDLPALCHALSQLAQVDALWEPAHWLLAALLDGPSNNREQGLQTLLDLQTREPTGPATRATTRTLLELGLETDLCTLLEQVGSASFTPLEQLCLRLLAAPDAPLRSEWLSEAAISSQPATMDAFAAVLGLDAKADGAPSNPLWKLAVGRSLARQPWDALELLGAGNRQPLPLLLGLDRGFEQRQHGTLIQGLDDWSQQPGFESLKVVAALLSEVHGDSDDTRRLWQNVLAWDPTSEVAYRAASERGAELQPLDLETLARNYQNPDRVALLLLEAANNLRASAPQECLRLLSSAAERCPHLPFAYRWANELAAQQQDPSSLLDWLERRRSALPEASSWVTTALQTAFQLADKDRSQAAQLIAEVAAAFPNDLSLQQLGQSLVREAWGDWQPSFAKHFDQPVERARWLMHLAVGQQRTDLAQATQLAAEAQQLDATALGQWLLEHWSDQLATPEWRHALNEELERSPKEPSAVPLAERLAALADDQHDIPIAKSCWQRVLHHNPRSLAALRGLEAAQITTLALSELQVTETTLAETLSDHEAAPHAAAHLLLQGQATASPMLIERMLANEPAPLVALRAALVAAWNGKDTARELEITLHLLDRTGSEEDHAALALRGAQLAAKLNDMALVETLLERVLSIVPNHTVALAAQADLYMHLDQWPRVAQALSAFAAASHVTPHRAEALHQAALIWLDRLADGERGEAALEAAARLAPSDVDLAERLERHYLETEQRVKLLELIEHRLGDAANADQKQRLLALRDRTLQEVGATPRPRPVAQQVDASPEHHEALEAYARRSFASGELKAAEGAWLQLARIVPDPTKQADYYRNLAELYCKADFNLSRAAVCFAEVRKRLPNDLPTAERLIDLYERLQRNAEAIELQNELLKGARDDSERRRWTLRLAMLHAARDPKQAELLLQQARKSWPHQVDVLQALAQLYQKGEQAASLQSLLERATKEAKNELLGGSFDPKPFDVLRTCAEIRHDVDAAHVVRGTQVALATAHEIVVGKDRLVTGMGAKAMSPRIDKLLLPEALSPALRTLLDDVGQALDHATRQDLTTLGAIPLHERDAALAGYCRDIARSVGVQELDLQVSSQVGVDIVPWSCAPPCLVLGQSLVVSGDRPLLTYLLYRSLKLIAARCSALVRGTPADAQLRLCALLGALIPEWQPPGLDRSLIEPLSDRISSELPANARARLEPLAQEIVSVFGARTAQIGGLIERWAQRSALLATGDVSVALRVIAALTSKDNPLPDEAASRARWVAKTPLARDLVLFSVSEEYFAARRTQTQP